MSTHGILKSYGKKFLNSLFDAMTDAGLVSTVLEGEYPLLGITEAGTELLFDQEKSVSMQYPEVGLPCRTIKKKVESNDNGERIPLSGRVGKKANFREELELSDRRLYDLMVKERMRLAMIRKVKPYQIFANATLLEFARVRPRTLSEAAEIKGVGKAKLGSIVPVFLKIIEEYED